VLAVLAVLALIGAAPCATQAEDWPTFRHDNRRSGVTEGAVSLPPTIGGGRAYFGADDGFAYCIDTSTGKPIWKFRPAKSPRHIPSDGKLISLWPVRTGVLLDGERALFGASLVPWETSYLCSLNAASGEVKFVTEHGVTMQGAMPAASDSLYVPQGRSAPLRYALADGARGKAYGLAFAGGRLYVSTSLGHIYCFSAAKQAADSHFLRL